jgi:hypothetical protein
MLYPAPHCMPHLPHYCFRHAVGYAVCSLGVEAEGRPYFSGHLRLGEDKEGSRPVSGREIVMELNMYGGELSPGGGTRPSQSQKRAEGIRNQFASTFPGISLIQR